MLILYDTSESPKYPLEVSKSNFFINHNYDGLDLLTFDIETSNEYYKYIANEVRVQTDDNRFVIRSIDEHGDESTIDCELDLDDWRAAFYKVHKTTSAFLSEVLSLIKPNGWNVAGAGISASRQTIELENVTAFDILMKASTTYDVVFNFDTLHKQIKVIAPSSYLPSGTYLTDELNLKRIKFKGMSTDLITRIYPYGKDGLTIADVNGGKEYVENLGYSKRIVSIAWKDERYAVAENLKVDAQKKLDKIAFPQCSYECEINDLAKTNEDFTFLTFWLYKVVTLIDRRRKTRINHQIVEYKEYPLAPENNVVTLSTTAPRIENSIKDLQNDIVEQIENSNNYMENAIKHNNDMILGNKGGCFKWRFSKEGYPIEQYVMDTSDINTAKNMWIQNQKGMGISHNNLAGPIISAWTIDGQFNADLITFGTLKGSLIEAGSISAQALSVDYRNSVTNAITDGIKTFETVTLEQIFKAADGTFRSEIKKEVTPAINAARDAKSAADAAQSSADTGLQNISDIISDSKLTPNEKTLASKEWATITAEHGDLQKQQKAFNISCNYESTYTELETYLTPLWANMSGTSEIVAATYRQKFVNYYTARQNLLNKIAEITKKTADTANNTANTAAENYTNISQNAEIIKLMSGEKLGRDELRTETSLIINPTAVQIAWNNISQSIQFEGSNLAEMNIYDGSTIGKKKLMSLGSSGIKIFNKDSFVGAIGTNTWSETNSKGLDFDLDTGGHFMFWGKLDGDCQHYYMKFAYHDGAILSEGLHMGCKLYLNNNKLITNSGELYAALTSWENGAGIEFDHKFLVVSSNGNSTKFEVENNYVNCWENLNMNNYSILNQSDARLKTNIVASANILDELLQLQVNSFDWIYDNRHVSYGLIAQELKTVFPELVQADDSGILSINYLGLVPYLLKAIQELSAKTEPIMPKVVMKTIAAYDHYEDIEKTEFAKKQMLKRIVTAKAPTEYTLPIHKVEEVNGQNKSTTQKV